MKNYAIELQTHAGNKPPEQKEKTEKNQVITEWKLGENSIIITG